VDACWACGVCAQFGSRAGAALLADRHRWFGAVGRRAPALKYGAHNLCRDIRGKFSNTYQRLLLSSSCHLFFFLFRLRFLPFRPPPPPPPPPCLGTSGPQSPKPASKVSDSDFV